LFSYSDLHSLIQKNLYRIPKDIDLVIGIPRSGLMPAAHIATSLNLPLQTLNDVSRKLSAKDHFTSRPIRIAEQFRHVLIVDDTSNSGLRLTQAHNFVTERYKGVKITTLAICSALNQAYSPDIAFCSSLVPRIFAWNIFNHPGMTPGIAIDLDGILCIDPSPEQNDDGDKYLEFIRHTELKMSPSMQVLAIITGRLEKYRSETEEWLHRNSIQYLHLYMNDAPTAHFRRTERYQIGNLLVDQISEFKSRVLSTLNPPLFVESNLEQAVNIHKITGTNTYAFDSDEYFGSENFNV